MTLDFHTLVTVIGVVAALLAGCVGYLIKVERTLARIDTSLSAFCGESQRDRTALWEHLNDHKDAHQHVAERVGVIETKLAMMPHVNQRQKPA